MNEQLNPIDQALQDILQEPFSAQMLLWTSKVEPKNFVLKINEQRYLGVPRLDCQQQTYWKFHPLTNQLENK
jgi:hypothetical protein